MIVVKSPSVCGGIYLLSYLDVVKLVSEVSTYKEVVELFWGELSVTPFFFHWWCLPGRCMVIYPDIGGYTSVAEVWCGESYFFCARDVGGYSSLWIE